MWRHLQGERSCVQAAEWPLFALFLTAWKEEVVCSSNSTLDLVYTFKWRVESEFRRKTWSRWFKCEVVSEWGGIWPKFWDVWRCCAEIHFWNFGCFGQGLAS